MNDNINKVLIIEDNEEVVEAISLALQIRWPKVDIISTSHGTEGIQIAASESLDVIILDLGLPDLNGFNVLKEITAFSKAPVVIVTAKDEEKDIVRGLELGANQYITKPFHQLELISRINAACNRNISPKPHSVITHERLKLYPMENVIEKDGKKIDLTHTECVILLKLIENAGTTMTYDNLAEELWEDDEYKEAAATIKVHINRLRRKLEDDPKNPKLIITKHGLGYFLAK
jgi:two-component system, OmpR family, response regulator VicR